MARVNKVTNKPKATHIAKNPLNRNGVKKNVGTSKLGTNQTSKNNKKKTSKLGKINPKANTADALKNGTKIKHVSKINTKRGVKANKVDALDIIEDEHLTKVLKKQIQKHVEESISPEITPEKSKTTPKKTILKKKNDKNKSSGSSDATPNNSARHVSFDNPMKKGVGGRKRKGEVQTEDETETKVSAMKKKERKQLRKATEQEEKYELSMKAKKIWEELRRHDVSEDKKAQLCIDLWKMLKGNLLKVIFAHDTTRVAASLMKFADIKIKNEMFLEVKDHLLELCKSKYAKFFVLKILKVGGKVQREAVFTCFQGHVRKLIKHLEAASVVEHAYNEVANAAQRGSMVSEFYGAKFAYLKESDLQTLPALLASRPRERDLILRSMYECLLPLAEKQSLRHSLVHRALREFLENCGDKQRRDMVEALHLSLPHILHTRDGSRVGMYCIWHATNKEKESIVRTLTSLVSKACCDEQGHLVILALIDSVTSVKVMLKVIIKELVKDLPSVLHSEHGRKVLLYLLAHRHPSVFHPHTITLMSQGDDRNKLSGVEVKSRLCQLLEPILAPLLTCMSEGVEEMVTTCPIFLLTYLTKCPGDVSSVYQALCQVLARPPPVTGGVAIENPHLHMILKKLIGHDRQTYVEDADRVLFSDILLETVPATSLKAWTGCNRGCFTIVFLLESEVPRIVTNLQDLLEDSKGRLAASKLKGAAVLLKKLQ